MYEIRQNRDMLTGTSLIITIEESELDKKALYTIQETKPGFLLPFCMRHVDGKIEFVYQITTLCKLQHITGNCTVKEYARLWRSILSPLLECDDWFMKIQSFVLDVEHLYYDKDKKSVSFVYIPTMQVCSEYTELKKMAEELAKQISVMDMALENKVLREIMNSFKPKEFLYMLNEYIPETERCAMALPKKEMPAEPKPIKLPQEKASPISSSLKDVQTEKYVNEPLSSVRADNAPSDFESGNTSHGDIVINMQPNGKDRKKQKEKRKSSDKSEKRVRKEAKKNKGAEKADNVENIRSASHDMSFTHGEARVSIESSPIQNKPLIMNSESLDDATQLVSVMEFACVLRLIGSPILPSLIRIQIGEGGVFTIGRYDASVGRQQSSFEFERKTKAISRRHAAIERHSGGYSLTDLYSSAGTYLNGQKLPPNTPFEVENGARISFGTCGADYVLELG